MNPLSQLKIGQRLALAFGLILATSALLVAVALVQAHALNADLLRYDQRVLPSVRTIRTVLEAIGSARRHESQNLLATTDAELADLEKKIRRDRADVADNLQAYGSMIADAEDRADYERLRSLASTYWELQDRVLALSRNKAKDPAQFAAAVKLLLGDSRQAYYALDDAAVAWSKHNEQLGNTLAVSAQQTYHRASVTLYTLASGALLLGALTALAISRSITKPLRAAVALAGAVTRGDLTQRIQVTSRDEVGELLHSLNEMAGQLAALVGDVFKSAESVNVAAREISQGNDDLSRRTQAQAASLEETAASMEEITSIGKNNADNAANADQLARSAHDLAATGGSVVAEAVTAMAAINEGSAKISNIISVIDEIAFQTNLLALNAAVEAARAGEQGRGFAVVAAEVRGLAQRSADAAKEIKALINDSVNKVQAGTELVDRSGQTLTRIVSSVKKMTDLIAEIATASKEQAMGVSRVNEAILQLDGATQQNAALVEEGSAASRTLQTQADALARHAAYFRVGDGALAARAPQSPGSRAAVAAPRAADAPAQHELLRRAG